MPKDEPVTDSDEGNDISITFETPDGRTQLNGDGLKVNDEREPEKEENGVGTDDVEEDEPITVHVGSPPEDIGTISGMDLDTYIIDQEIAPMMEEGERYPGWRVGLSRKVGAYIELIRPFTLLAPLFGGLSASLIALVVLDFEGFSWPTLIYGVATLMILNAASNCMNAAYDAHIDRINKPYRPIPKGLITRDEASSLAFILYFFALFRAILISYQFFALVLIISIFTIYYSMPPIRLKKRLWVSNITIAFARGGLGFMAGWTIFGDPSNPTPWVIGGILMIYLVGATTSKDFTDAEGDSKYGMRTLPVVYGPKRAALISGPFFIVPFILIPVGVLRGHLIEAANYLLILVAWGAYVMWLLQTHATERDPNFENSPVWKHMYLMLFALQLGFAGVYLADYLAL
ncbi:MAG: geranylgeranylglycerol-phosphate geranylgeranyltransferase [Candidatus Thermoplasmatota archaeon]|nr:geranylgeranylglycerol-phosphate geranylgeranyltransferase [Candidatus Thermoplasmatota archaeon]